MDALRSLLSLIAVACLIALGLTFGLALFLLFLGLATVVAAVVTLRYYWLRWKLSKEGTPLETADMPARPQVIDVEYRDITER